MNLKAALCPSCGGKLQLPDDKPTASCAYCGAMVTVQEAFRLAGRVRDFTIATKLEKIREHTPFDVAAAKRLNNQILIFVAIGGLLISFCLGGSNRGFGVLMALIFLGLIPIIYFIRSDSLRKIIAADQEILQKGPMVTVIGYKGMCPYCDTSITTKGNVKGETCSACQKRFIVSDSKFYSVDTPLAASIKRPIL